MPLPLSLFFLLSFVVFFSSILVFGSSVDVLRSESHRLHGEEAVRRAPQRVSSPGFVLFFSFFFCFCSSFFFCFSFLISSEKQQKRQ